MPTFILITIRNEFINLKKIFILYILSFLIIFIDGFPLASATAKYSILIDAGSSGSRMFLYKWQSDQEFGGIINGISVAKDSKGEMVVHKNSPGLSNFVENLSELEPYIKDLIDHAINFIPSSEIPKTHIFVLATAGMRFLSENDQNKIWNEVKSIIKRNYKLYFTSEMAKTISGFEEGVYGWVAVNYLAKTLLKDTSQQIGMIDMGGGSMQIAFNVANTKISNSDSSSIFKFKIGNKNYEIYSTTYLGYGVNSARKIYRASLVINSSQSNFDTNQPTYLKDGCLHKSVVEVVLPDDFEEYDSFFNTRFASIYSKGIFILQGSGILDECLQNQKRILGKDLPCKYSSCGMMGQYQPLISQDTKNIFYGLSEFWYTTKDVSVPNYYEFENFYKDSKAYCSLNVSDISVLSYKKFLGDNHERQSFDDIVDKKKNRCFIASWILTTLHEGFGFNKNYKNFNPIDFISEIEVQWSLGALLLLYSQVSIKSENLSDWTCQLVNLRVFLFLLASCVGFYLIRRFFLSHLWSCLKTLIRLDKPRQTRMNKTESYHKINGMQSKL